MSKKSRQRHTNASATRGESPADEFLDQLLTDLWTALSSGDLLEAEVETARCISLPYLLGLDPDKADSIFIDLAMQTRRPEDAALLRLIVLLGSPAVKRKASRALAELTSAGVYPAEWVAEAGKATPLRAWWRYDVFGDAETIFVLYGYAGGRHAFEVRVDLASLPAVSGIDLIVDTDDLADYIERSGAIFDLCEEIDLAEARRRVERALAGSEADFSSAVIAYLPILQSRVRRLPASPPGDSGPATPVFTAADRAAAVADFMNSPQAADAAAADEAATRFWAEVLTSYSSRTPGDPPGQVGPRKLDAILDFYVPETYTLTEGQRRHLRPAVTAWARWSAARRGLNEAAAEHLVSGLDETLDLFGEAYDDPDAAAIRAYVADVATSDADAAWLDDVTFRRATAIPLPGDRPLDERTGTLDASDPDDRREYVAAEFGDCDVPDGMSRAEFLFAAHRAIEELWHGDLPATWKRARRLLQDRDRHDVIHSLMDLKPRELPQA